MSRDTLASYPFVAVRIACRNCKRRGRYRLAHLAERFRADATLDEVLTADCNLAGNHTGPRGCRAAYFPDLDPAPPLPRRASLRVIAGGRRLPGEE